MGHIRIMETVMRQVEGKCISIQNVKRGEYNMMLKMLPYDITVCKVASFADIDLQAGFFMIGKTEEELSLVCVTSDTPARTTEREDGWRGFRIEGQLDFSLTGILSKLSAVLAENGIGIFAVSTYNTDYIFVKKDNLDRAKASLRQAGYQFTLESKGKQ